MVASENFKEMFSEVSYKPCVVYWNNIPSPYMVDRFNAVADRRSFDFEAWFNDRSEATRSWEVDENSWRFRYRYIPSSRLFGRIQHWPLLILRGQPDILVSLYAEPSFLFGLLVAKLRGVKTGIWVEVTFDRWVRRTKFKEILKKWIFPRMHAIITVSKDGKKFAERYGADEERIYFAPHVIDVAHFKAGSQLSAFERRSLRQELSLAGTVFIYVGRFWWGKGLNYLLDAVERVQREISEEISLLLVGDGPEENNLKRASLERDIRNVVFTGFKQQAELPRYFAIADVFVFPTLGDPYGLVVDEAMACSLPVISTTGAGEIKDRVEEGVNGYLVPPQDSDALARRMRELASNAALRSQMGKASAEKIQGHTPEKWAQDFELIVHALLKDAR